MSYPKIEYTECSVCGVLIPKGDYVKQAFGKPLSKVEFANRVCKNLVEKPDKIKNCGLKKQGIF